MEEEVTYAGRTSTGRKPMREILFRGKRIEDKEWVYGTYMAHDRDGHAIFNRNFGDGTLQGFEVIPETVGQYTGLDDKNGVKVFEGDIVREHANDYTPIYQNGIYMAYNVDKINDPYVSTQFNVIWRNGCEVIGNIHDNPELMEVRE